MDFANDLSLSSEQLNMATKIAAQFFAAPIADSLRNPKAPGAWTFSRIVIEAALYDVLAPGDKRDFARHPSSMSDFVLIAEATFSKPLLHHLQLRAADFDTVSGFRLVSVYFICSRPAIDAVEDIIWAITAYSATKVSEILPRSTDVRSSSNAGAVHSPCRIQQIRLEGPTIAEAWGANNTTRAMEAEAVAAAGSNEDPSKMRFRPLAVYHGTNSAVEDHRETRVNPLLSNRLDPHVTKNQVAPTSGRVLPVVWTGFSPLRCFLWAAFKAEVLQNVPTVAATRRLERSWDCPVGSDPGPLHQHQGVTLFKFRPSLPSAPGQTYYVMPLGREAEWEGICYNHGGTVYTPVDTAASRVKHLWDQFASIHGGALNTWPNALHCREFGPQLNMLRSYTKQIWRTVWFEKGAEALNNSHEITYAISFKLTVPAPSHVSQNKEKSHTA